MARPTISNNSPVAGSISWTGFGIAFNGIQSGVAAGSTDKAFTWWVYNNGAPYLATSNTYPTDLAFEDTMLFFNKNGIGMLAIGASTLEGGLIVPGSIYAEAIHADEIKTWHLAADAVTANKIGANVIVGNHISANSVTVDKLGVGSVGDSAVVNSSFEEYDASGVPLGWEISAMTGGTLAIVPYNASSGAQSLMMDADVTTADLRLRQKPAQFIPVSSASGRQWYLMCRAGGTIASSKGLYLRANWYTAAKVFISSSDAVVNSAFTTSFTVYEGIVTPPSTARFMSVEIILTQPSAATELYVDEVTAQEVIVSAQIGAGQITTPKLAANAVVASTVAAGAISAKHLVISDFTNLLMDPLLARPIGETWFRRSGATTASNIVVTTGGEGNTWKLDGVSTEVSVWSDFIEVQPNQKFYINALVQQQLIGGSPALGYMRMEWYKKDKVTSAGAQSSVTINSQAWAPIEAIFAAPVSAYYGRLMFIHGVGITGGSMWIANPSVRRMNAGELLVDGAITADKLAVNAVEADAISVGALDGKVLTGSTVRTAATGARVELNTTGLIGIDSNGLQYLTANASGLSVEGTLSGKGVGKTPANVARDVTITMGAGVQRQGLQTEQWPPYPADSGTAIPGIAFKPAGVTMYQYGGLTSSDGHSVTLGAGTSSENTPNVGDYPGALTLSSMSAYLNVPLTINGDATISGTTVSKLPRGLVNRHIRTTAIGATAYSTQTIIDALTPVTFIGGRNYQITWRFSMYMNVTNSTMIFGISRAATTDAWNSTAGMTQLTSVAQRVDATLEGREVNFSAFFTTPTTATYQLKVWIQRVSGTGTLNYAAESTNPAYILVEDQGAMI